MDHLELFSHKMNQKFSKKKKMKSMIKAKSVQITSKSDVFDPNVSQLPLISAKKKPNQSMF